MATSKTLLGRLNEYTEFIAILAAAIGGFLWFESLVAKRSDIENVHREMAELARQETVEQMNCLLRNYMTLAQRQLRLAQLNNDLTARERELSIGRLEAKLEADPSLQLTLRNQSEFVVQEIAAIKGDIRSEDAVIRDIRNALERQECNE